MQICNRNVAILQQKLSHEYVAYVPDLHKMEILTNPILETDIRQVDRLSVTGLNDI